MVRTLVSTLPVSNRPSQEMKKWAGLIVNNFSTPHSNLKTPYNFHILHTEVKPIFDILNNYIYVDSFPLAGVFKFFLFKSSMLFKGIVRYFEIPCLFQDSRSCEKHGFPIPCHIHPVLGMAMISVTLTACAGHRSKLELHCKYGIHDANVWSVLLDCTSFCMTEHAQKCFKCNGKNVYTVSYPIFHISLVHKHLK